MYYDVKISINDKVTGTPNTVLITKMLHPNRGCKSKDELFPLGVCGPLDKEPLPPLSL